MRSVVVVAAIVVVALVVALIVIVIVIVAVLAVGVRSAVIVPRQMGEGGQRLERDSDGHQHQAQKHPSVPCKPCVSLHHGRER